MRVASVGKPDGVFLMLGIKLDPVSIYRNATYDWYMLRIIDKNRAWANIGGGRRCLHSIAIYADCRIARLCVNLFLQ